MSTRRDSDLRTVADDARPLDRGLQFGDGVFETVWLDAGRPFALDWHWARFEAGCRALMLPVPDRVMVCGALARAWRVAGRPRGALAKWLWTAGPGERGYDRPDPLRPSLMARCAPAGDDPLVVGSAAYVVVVSTVTASIQPGLARIKHLNRLDQVVARARLAAWCATRRDGFGDADGAARRVATATTADTAFGRAPTRYEALLCDAEGRIVCASAANVAFRIGGRWWTPALARAGVAGTRRAAWLAGPRAGDADADDGLPRLEVRDLDLDDLRRADAGLLLGTGVGLARIDTLLDAAGHRVGVLDRTGLPVETLAAYRRALRRRLMQTPVLWPGPAEGA